MPDTEVLVGRHKRLSFMEVNGTYMRMTKFTAFDESKSPKEYSRQYIDQATESTDLVGFSTAHSFSFDRHTNNAVHKKIADINDRELTGTDAQVNVVTVDLFDEASDGSFVARKRTFAVIPSGAGNGTDALIYAGDFKAVSGITEGTATSSDDWQTLTFSEG